ncbi:Septum formation initiator [Gemmatirosa kalamazoonensis]|uniref:Septum formation initiator n=1 Tax=Gemmatirosa kalamazoonensis TaxID=861299 RepID=W0RHE4_9BACT|nr:septum formation initiator family protein [Gemmatirosa kalamazoonensis]AHG90549.1 Septum formation initiator [Gemmatirosa kalamazoonensis]
MIRKLLIGAIVLGVVVYALQGGEYGTTDLLRQRARKKSLLAGIDSLQRQVDSLGALQKRLETDPALQERIAREEFGMVRGEKELLYRFADPRPDADSTKRGP